MSSVNRVILIGNLGKDPDIRDVNGSKVANFSLATGEHWKDKQSGDAKERVQWHNVVVFNAALAEICQNHLKKGAKVYIEGALEYRSFEKDGAKRQVTEVVLRPYRGELQMVGKPAGPRPR